MSYIILHVTEPWHHKDHGKIVERGHEFHHPDDVAKILRERPGHVVKRMATPDEAAAIDAQLAAHAAPEAEADTEAA